MSTILDQNTTQRRLDKAQGHHFLDPWPELIPPQVFNKVHKLGDDTHWDSSHQVIFKPVHKSRKRVPSGFLVAMQSWNKISLIPEKRMGPPPN